MDHLREHPVGASGPCATGFRSPPKAGEHDPKHDWFCRDVRCRSSLCSRVSTLKRTLQISEQSTCIFTIENGTNNVTVHATVQEAETIANAELFRSEAGLARLAADWPMVKLVEIWNSLPGAEPVNKFKDRAAAVNRIWKAIQALGGAEEATQSIEADARYPFC